MNNSALTFGGPTAAPSATDGKSLSERLRDRTTLRFMGNCKCGNCQLVARPLLDEAIAATAVMSTMEVELSMRRAIMASLGYPWLPCPICNGVEGCDHIMLERARAALTDGAPLDQAKVREP